MAVFVFWVYPYAEIHCGRVGGKRRQKVITLPSAEVVDPVASGQPLIVSTCSLLKGIALMGLGLQ